MFKEIIFKLLVQMTVPSCSELSKAVSPCVWKL